LEQIRKDWPTDGDTLKDPSDWPSAHTLIVQLREALGLPAGALAMSPQQAWEQALDETRQLRGEAAFWASR
jgi:hypothetical protein